MKQYLHALLMCQNMFCAIPAPQLWDEQAKDKMLLFLPVVGLEIGGIWVAAAWLCRLLTLPALVTGLILCACPYIVTGFIHLDGFMDVTDAVRSWRELSRRQEILKDPHVGSFAVIYVAFLILAQFSLFASASDGANVWILLFIPAVSRCCSALAVTGLKPMSTSQYAGRTRPTSHIVVLTAALCILLGMGFLLCGRYGLALIGAVIGYALALHRAYKSLAGMNGDIAGYALTIGELCAVAVYTLI